MVIGLLETEPQMRLIRSQADMLTELLEKLGAGRIKVTVLAPRNDEDAKKLVFKHHRCHDQ